MTANTDTQSQDAQYEQNSIDQTANGAPSDILTGTGSARLGNRECKSTHCTNTVPSYRNYCNACRPGVSNPFTNPNPTPDTEQTCKTPVCDNSVKPWESYCSEHSLSVDDLDIINTPTLEDDDEESQLDRVERKLDRLLEFFEIDDVGGEEDG